MRGQFLVLVCRFSGTLLEVLEPSRGYQPEKVALLFLPTLDTRHCWRY